MTSFLRRRAVESKTPDQVRAMRAAGLVVAETLALVREQAVVGVTTGALDAAAERNIRSAGATPSFQGYHGFPGSLCISVNDEVVHGIPGERVLADGDLVSIDCGAIVQGWHGDSAISLIVGGSAAGRAEDLALMDDTESAMWAGIAAMRAGGHLHEIGAAVEEYALGRLAQRREDGLADLEYGIVEDFTGHGIGREMHMEPHVPNYAAQGKGPKLPVGATLAIEPMLTLGTIETRTLDDDWTVVTVDGSRASHWEHTVAVTGTGVWVLTALDGGAAGLASVGAADRFAPLSTRAESS